MTTAAEECDFLHAVGEAEEPQPFALALDDFIAAKSDAPAALVGEADEILVPHAGLVILYAKGGKGKTTLTVDAAFHFAAGFQWLGFVVRRPLRVLLIENEGPREPFREKLGARRAAWHHDIAGEIFIHAENWGALRLSDGVERLRAFIGAEQIDLVIGDPLDSLGVNGVGSPEDTREFVELLKAAGLFRDVAWWLLHHGRKQEADDELDEISGAWGGRSDTMMRLDKLAGDRGRLSFPKIRWSRRGTRPALILGFDSQTQSFAVVGEEGPEERDYVAEVEELLAASRDRWMTPKEIAAPKDKAGIGAQVDTVRRLLEADPARFEQRTGDAAKLVGRHPSATVWQVTSASRSPGSPCDLQGLRPGGDLGDLAL